MNVSMGEVLFVCLSRARSASVKHTNKTLPILTFNNACPSLYALDPSYYELSNLGNTANNKLICFSIHDISISDAEYFLKCNTKKLLFFKCLEPGFGEKGLSIGTSTRKHRTYSGF